MKRNPYKIKSLTIQELLSKVESGEMDVPSIQRPFVWSPSKVRNLIDSLFHGYPVGYIITWLKSESTTQETNLLIDGQQRVTALIAAILGRSVLDSKYHKKDIKIAFNPINNKFEVKNSLIANDPEWILDISSVFASDFNLSAFLDSYCNVNEVENRDDIEYAINQLMLVTTRQIGVIELENDIPFDTIATIFYRINREGVKLNKADFVMSKVAVQQRHGGESIKKTIDLFCRLQHNPTDYQDVKNNNDEYTNSLYFNLIEWVKDLKDKTYVPMYKDILRVAFTSTTYKGKMDYLVELLSGANFEVKEYRDAIVADTMKKVNIGVTQFVKEENFKDFIQLVKEIGATSPSLIKTQNWLNFGYTLYLALKLRRYNDDHLRTLVKKWLAFTLITGRYSKTSVDSVFESDINNFFEYDRPEDFIKEMEEDVLTDNFWTGQLPTNLNLATTTTQYFYLLPIVQIYNKETVFMNRGLTVEAAYKAGTTMSILFPKRTLSRYNYRSKKQYYQVGNVTFMAKDYVQHLGGKAPKIFFKQLKKEMGLNDISEYTELIDNMKTHCVPTDIFHMDGENFREFLDLRYQLISDKIKEYYFNM